MTKLPEVGKATKELNLSTASLEDVAEFSKQFWERQEFVYEQECNEFIDFINEYNQLKKDVEELKKLIKKE